MAQTAMSEKKKGSLKFRQSLIGYSFIAPNFLGFAIFILFPVIFTIILSVMNWDGFNAMTFAGFDNFRSIFRDRVFKSAFWLTLLYVVFTVVLTLLASLALACVLNRKIKGRDVFRYGPINMALRAIGVSNPPGWFASTDWAIWGVIVVAIWKFMGYYMLIYLAGLQDIPVQLYEAATLDGATGWQKFRKITLPMLTPSTFFVFMMLTINSFKSFDLIYALTMGGPGTSTTLLANYIYNQTFVYWDYGKSAAASIILFVIVLAVTIVQFRGEKKFTDYL